MTEAERINKARLAFIPAVERACKARNAALGRFAADPTPGAADAYRAAKAGADAAEAELRGLWDRWVAARGSDDRDIGAPAVAP